MSAEELAAACARHGIATRYHDAWGREYVVPETTLRALLSAMGAGQGALSATPTADANARPLVWRVGDPAPRLRVAVPASALAQAAAGADALCWTLVLESGERRHGRCAPVEQDTATAHAVEVECVGVPPPPCGYHALEVHPALLDRSPPARPAAGGDASAGGRRMEGVAPDDAPATDTALATRALVACPRCCVTPAPGVRLFGPAVQLYALRSRRNWGMGDFTDLAALAREAAPQGASFVGVNPLHELFLDRPGEPSPYSPSTRRALNPLYIDVEAVEDYAECAPAREHVASAAFQAELSRLRAVPLVDYVAVARAKLAVLHLLYAHFRDAHLARDTLRAQSFHAFTQAEAARVADAARFDALQAALRAADPAAWGWPAWPAECRDHASAAVQAFATRHAREVGFFLYLQWQADLQLAQAHAAARAAGMSLGLYRDVAVGANPGGAETWQAPARYALGVHVGAPPDAFNQKGQDWGLPPWLPERLPHCTYAPWVGLLRANLRHAGALRIDHVMALMRLFWIPAGALPVEGTYVRYPLADLLAILALESERHGALVVGEDLGTVPDEVRAALREHGVLSYRVLYFERSGDGAFVAPHDYPAQALVTASTHDLPTLEGFWQGVDLAARDALDLFPDAAVRERQYADRQAARCALLRALAQAGLLAPAAPTDPAGPLGLERVLAVHRYLARTSAALMSVQLEDVFGEREQVNLPATTDAQYPNWRRKLPVDLEDYARDGRFAAVCGAIRGEGRGQPLACDTIAGDALAGDARAPGRA